MNKKQKTTIDYMSQAKEAMELEAGIDSMLGDFLNRDKGNHPETGKPINAQLRIELTGTGDRKSILLNTCENEQERLIAKCLQAVQSELHKHAKNHRYKVSRQLETFGPQDNPKDDLS